MSGAKLKGTLMRRALVSRLLILLLAAPAALFAQEETA